ncbi:MAG: hypothetical protein K2W96_00830, partial [Gemmataceae bacterium]|nr:hypothetical protein [Gemmataceae bacterium]
LEARDHYEELASCDQLCWLAGLGLSGIGAAGAEAVIGSLSGSSLAELDLSGNALEGDPVLAELGWQLPRLERLSLADNGLAGSDALEALGERLLDRLRSFDLSGNRGLGAEALGYLADRTPRLERLALDRIPYLVGAIDALAFRSPSLRTIHADRSVTRDERRYLRETHPRIEFRFGERPG